MMDAEEHRAAKLEREREREERCNRLFSELATMARYLQGQGKEIPQEALEIQGCGPETFDRNEDCLKLVRAHSRMAALVAPATPLSLTSTERNGKPAGLSQIPLLKSMMWACALAVVAFLVSSVIAVNFPTTAVWTTQLSYLAAAAVGASFFGLYRAHGFVSARTFNPAYGAQYWVRFTLGILAGLILANIVDPNVLALASEGTASPSDAERLLTQNVIALLGGYSADVVNRILTRLVETLETLVVGRTTDLVEAQRRAIEASVRGQTQRERVTQAAELMALYDQLKGEKIPQELEEKFKEVMERALTEAQG